MKDFRRKVVKFQCVVVVVVILVVVIVAHQLPFKPLHLNLHLFQFPPVLPPHIPTPQVVVKAFSQGEFKVTQQITCLSIVAVAGYGSLNDTLENMNESFLRLS